MPDVITSGEPMTGTAAGELIADVPGGAGPDSTINGNDGNDLIFGDSDRLFVSYHDRGNDSIATAQNIDNPANWSLSTDNPIIDAPAPHTSVYVELPGGLGAVRYYSVTVNPGDTLTVDVDCWLPEDHVLRVDIYDASGTLLEKAAVEEVDSGSLAYQYDPYFRFLNTAEDAQTIYIGVRSRWPTAPILLNVSVTNHPAEAPLIIAGNDTISGGAGDDTIFGMLGTDSVHGNDGNDVIVSTGLGSYYGDSGNDRLLPGGASFSETLDGGAGSDTLDVSRWLDVVADLGALTSLVSIENIIAGYGNDRLTGSAHANSLNGGEGDDILDGRAGDDSLSGGGGDDVIVGGLGADHLSGGPGNDTYYVDDVGDVVNDGYFGIDLVVATVSYSLQNYPAWSIESLTLQGPLARLGTGNYMDNVIRGTTGANVLKGRGGSDELFGNAGDDQIYGGPRGDRLHGSAGDDALFGGRGDDVLDGGIGADQMWGTVGDDLYHVDDAEDIVSEGRPPDAPYWYPVGGVDRVQATIDYVLVDDVENLTLKGALALVGTGNELANIITGSSAANTLVGLEGDDRLFGQNGDDQLDGGAGNDRLLGESGRDVLLAGDGDDVLSGGSNSDTLAGGAGQDSFVFGEGEVGATPNTADRITDFSQADGDRISLRQIDADTAQAGDQNFQFQGSDDFTGIAGQVRYRHHDGNTFVEGDTDGDGAVDFVIRLDGLHTLAAGDFVL